MQKEIFKGTSETGDFQEALNIAITNAKESLETNFIIWDQLKLSGENGGIALVNRLTVEIHAICPN